MVLWELPGNSADRPHGLKYRLYCGLNGKCLVRYDHEAGKGAAVRVREPLCFADLPTLLNRILHHAATVTRLRPARLPS